VKIYDTLHGYTPSLLLYSTMTLINSINTASHSTQCTNARK